MSRTAVLVWKILAIVVGGIVVTVAVLFGLIIGFAHMISDPAQTGPAVSVGPQVEAGVRADGDQLEVALGGSCPAGTTYTLKFDSNNPGPDTVVFTDSDALAVFNPLDPPPSATVTSTLPDGFDWHSAWTVWLTVQTPDGTSRNTWMTLGSFSYAPAGRSDVFLWTNSSKDWYTVAQAVANPTWETVC